MDALYIPAAICSIVGMLFSLCAMLQAISASKAAKAARDAALVHSLSDELQLACLRGEQLVDYLQHKRYSEASIRLNELTLSLSELPHRRGPQLTTGHKNTLLTSRQQLLTIVQSFDSSSLKGEVMDNEQIMIVARRVAMRLREVLGDIRSHIDMEKTHG